MYQKRIYPAYRQEQQPPAQLFFMCPQGHEKCFPQTSHLLPIYKNEDDIAMDTVLFVLSKYTLRTCFQKGYEPIPRSCRGILCRQVLLLRIVVQFILDQRM